jgi:hypothetical protein
MSKTTFSWVITQLECHPLSDDKTNIIYNIIWDCCGIQEPENVAQSYRGQTNVTYTSGQPFTPYDQLTQEQILQWVFDSGINKTEIESSVQSQIDALLLPKQSTPNLPWLGAK